MFFPLPDKRLFILLVTAFCAVSSSVPASAQVINWSSMVRAQNLTSADQTLSRDFRFELGVFEGSFVPTLENAAQWAQYWRPAQVAYYNEQYSRFAETHLVRNNSAPFTAGKQAYIWGFQGTPQEGEWILFRKKTWNWPLASPSTTPNPLTHFSWVAEQADEIITGALNSQPSNPLSAHFLMKTMAVANMRPPTTHWNTWKQQMLGNTTNSLPSDDDDGDGVSNLMEFVMGSDPTKKSPPLTTPAHVIPHANQKHLQITIPRRVDHSASLIVEVADHPAGPWSSGGTFTSVVSDGIDSLIVRDNTPISPENPHRFMRLRVNPPH